MRLTSQGSSDQSKKLAVTVCCFEFFNTSRKTTSFYNDLKLASFPEKSCGDDWLPPAISVARWIRRWKAEGWNTQSRDAQRRCQSLGADLHFFSPVRSPVVTKGSGPVAPSTWCRSQVPRGGEENRPVGPSHVASI